MRNGITSYSATPPDGCGGGTDDGDDDDAHFPIAEVHLARDTRLDSVQWGFRACSIARHRIPVKAKRPFFHM